MGAVIIKWLLFFTIEIHPEMLVKTVKGISKAFKIAVIKTFDDLLFPYRMNEIEAAKILDLPNNYDFKMVETNFSKFYSANSPKNKGSSYIQEKIKEARDFLNAKRS